ncbi:anti-sigma factor [Arthrobacter monumenti]
MEDSNKQFADDLQTDLDEGRILEWAEVYALDAVSEEERTTIEVYISAAAQDVRTAFNERVRQARETATEAYATDVAEPPADLLDRIMARLPEHEIERPAVQAGSAAPAGAGAQDELALRRHRKESRPSTGRRLLIGAAAAAAIAIGSVTVAQNLPDPSLQEQVVEASDVRSESLEIPAGGTAEVALSESVGAAVVTLQNVPAPPPGKVYQMWRLPESGSAPESVGTMTGEDVSDTQTTVLKDFDGYSAVAITVEPEGGSEAPTMPIIAEIPLGA